MSFLRCSEVAPLRVLRARADLANQATLHQAGKACARRADTHRRVETQNNSAFQKARNDVGLSQVRVHDLRHTYGQRLRDAGVSEEDRALLLGHAGNGMPQHYAAATVAKRLEATNAVRKTRDRTMVLRGANG